MLQIKKTYSTYDEIIFLLKLFSLVYFGVKQNIMKEGIIAGTTTMSRKIISCGSNLSIMENKSQELKQRKFIGFGSKPAQEVTESNQFVEVGNTSTCRSM